MLHGVPPDLAGSSVEDFFGEIIADAQIAGSENMSAKVFERLARSIAARSAIHSGKILDTREMSSLFEQLLKCEHPGISPGGKPTWLQIDYDSLERHFS